MNRATADNQSAQAPRSCHAIQRFHANAARVSKSETNVSQKMHPHRPHRLTAVPPTLHARLEIAGAMQALADESRDDALRRRRAELAGLRRELEEIPQLLQQLHNDVLKALRAELRKYSRDQPRVAAGSPEGGQWTSQGADVQPRNQSAKLGPQYAALDTGIRTDAADVSAPTGPVAADFANGDDIRLAGDAVTPRGFTIEHLPGENPLDPKGLNVPITADEQQKVADALTQIINGDALTLTPHPYRNRPHSQTGSVLPASSLAGYVAYDVPGFGDGRGVHRLIIDHGTGAIYYTNNHYFSFYAVQLSSSSE